MKDRVSKNPGRVMLSPENGSAPFYATIRRADEPTQSGDPLSKATFLTDATAALFGMDDSALPNSVFEKIAGLVYGNDPSAIETVIPKFNIARVMQGSYVGTDTYGEDNPNRLELGFKPKIVLFNKGAHRVYVSGSTHWAAPGISAIFGDGNSLLMVESIDIEFNSTLLDVSIDETGVSWYTTEDTSGIAGEGAFQLNAAGETYSWVAIG